MASDGNPIVPLTIIRRVNSTGVGWFGGATWEGMRVMRVSVCNWMTTHDDIERALASVAKVLEEGFDTPKGKRFV